MKKASITLFHQFFPEEAEQAKQAMLQALYDIEKTEIEKKDYVASVGLKIKSLKAISAILAENLRRNGEDRKITTELYFDFANEKRIYKNAKGEIVRIMPFEERDYETPVPIGINEQEFDLTNPETLNNVVEQVNEGLKEKGVKVKLCNSEEIAIT